MERQCGRSRSCERRRPPAMTNQGGAVAAANHRIEDGQRDRPGGMPMSIEGRPDEERSVRTIHAALDAGVTLIDTADAYHRDPEEVGHNESLIAKALSSWSGNTDKVLVATKG